ncbi:hypothetical protein AB0K12_21655 [Nonomuraea sp. NPDC049419]|uniref:hypothetical protein n=1 Tax=Nonomuraea sp. NPDC049419 TaxID=3155772 RepID=UPI0034300C13
MAEAVAPAGRTEVARAWAEALTRIRAGDVPGTEHYISTLSPPQRAAIAAELPGHVTRNLGCAATPLLLAGAGCLSEPAEVASWLFKPELQPDRAEPPRKDKRSCPERTESRRLLALLRRRPPQWQADVARHITSRLRLPELRHWEVAAELTRETGIQPPGDHAFIVGWLRSLRSSPPGSPANDPLSAAYAPHLLDFDGLTHADLWLLVGAATRLVEDGLLTRTSVLETLLHKLTQESSSAPARPINARSARPHAGASARFTHPISGPMAATGRIERQPRFGERPTPCEATDPRAGRLTSAHLVGLHDRLNLTLDEAAPHAPDYVRLLSIGPLAVAVMALSQLWRLEEAGHLTEGLFAEALHALTYRPEKKLLRAAVEWADEAALRDASRTDVILASLTPVLTQDTPALRERAARLAMRLAAQPGPRERAATRQATAHQATDLRERLPPVTPL